MHNILFYPKLAAGNLWRNKTTYLPYLLACTVSIATFYVLLSINFNPYLSHMPSATYVQLFVGFGTVIVALFCAVLLFYTNGFLMKRRKKEMGLTYILGMEKRNMKRLLFFEALMVGAAALFLGILSGMLLSQLAFLILMNLIHSETILDMPISGKAMVLTALYFALVFLLLLFKNWFAVRMVNPIQLMSGAKEGEKEPKASLFITAVGLLMVGAGYSLAFILKNPGQALFGFLLAAILVIIGTYCLFTSGSIALLKTLRLRKHYYYTPKHFISVSSLIYRMKQNALGLASICILSCMVLVTVSSTVCLYAGVEDQAKQMKADYSLSFPNENDVAAADAAWQIAGKEASNAKVTLVQKRQYPRLVLLGRKNGSNGFDSSRGTGDFDQSVMFTFLSLTDYNAMEGKEEVLEPGEALLFFTGAPYQEDTVTVNGIAYQLKPIDMLQGFPSGQSSIIAEYTLIVPDLPAAIEADPLQERDRQLQLSFNVEGSLENRKAFDQAYYRHVAGGRPVSMESRIQFREGWYSIYGGFLFLGVYFGILFVLATAMMIYYKQISEGYEDQERFLILQKVGMSAKEVKKTIRRQTRTIFFSPLLVAVIHVLVASILVKRVLMGVFGIANTGLFYFTSAVVILVYALLYTLIYRQTAKTYYGLVRWERPGNL